MLQEHKLDLEVFEKKITDLSDALAKLSNEEDLRRLILIIKRPGWTTPAEFMFASSIVDNMMGVTRLLIDQKQSLLEASEAVSVRG